MLQQSFTVCGGYWSRTSLRFFRLSMRCVSAASMTSDIGGSSVGLDATIPSAWSSSLLLSSLSLRVVRSVGINGCAYGGWFSVILRLLNRILFKYDASTDLRPRRERRGDTAESMHAHRLGAYAGVHTLSMLMTSTCNPVGLVLRTRIQVSARTVTPHTDRVSRNHL